MKTLSLLHYFKTNNYRKKCSMFNYYPALVQSSHMYQLEDQNCQAPRGLALSRGKFVSIYASTTSDVYIHIHDFI